MSGVGYTYGSTACATVIQGKLRDIVVGSDPLEVTGTWETLARAIRNIGRPGVVSHAISEVDAAEGYRNSDSAHDLHLPSHLRCDSLSRGERWGACPRGRGESGTRGSPSVWC